MHDLLAAIYTTPLLGLCDHALMGYTFARVGAAVGMKVQDFYVQKNYTLAALLRSSFMVATPSVVIACRARTLHFTNRGPTDFWSMRLGYSEADQP